MKPQFQGRGVTTLTKIQETLHVWAVCTGEVEALIDLVCVSPGLAKGLFIW